MNNDSNIVLSSADKFLSDKEWWFEESEEFFILNVKKDGNHYKSEVDKDSISTIRSLDVKFMKKGIISMLVEKIKFQISNQIIKEELERKNDHHE
jgi:hypothetical protein